MRPEILFSLFAPTTALAGVGKHAARLLEKVAGPTVADLLWHLPTGIVDRRHMPKIADAPPGAIVTLALTVDAHLPARTARRPYKVRCSDDTGFLHLVFFNARADYLTKLLPVGARRIVSGRVELFNDERQMTHPDHVVPLEEVDKVTGIEPIYPLTAGLTPRMLGKAMQAALARAPELAEWHDPALVARERWATWHASLTTVHAPAGEADLAPATTARRRLAYDELLANQLALGLVRLNQRRLPGRSLVGDGRLTRAAIAALPFALTASQHTASAEIAEDLRSDRRMLRLLQGDVGSGKTVVALLAMLTAVEAGAQAALMAPTEILARQHFATIEPLAQAAGVRLASLTGRDKGKARTRLIEQLATGAIDLVVGTHALFQEDVAFHDLAVAVIDEQHRFGVHQRLTLATKGKGVDVLVMTATPIPRTLMMTAYGDLDVSRLTEKPAGRKPVDTRTLPAERLDEVVAGVARQLKTGAKVFWVCPLVEESDEVDLAAAVDRQKMLEQALAQPVGLVHGRMKAADKDRAMADFAEGELGVLVATTVIEVGVDVPAATVMVIEHAERFGLAQLHQLRGRIGRGDRPSTCLLLYQGPLGETARARLEILRQTEDGFRIAEEDLKLRGAGEMLGTRQSGMPTFKLADLAAHEDLLDLARADARHTLDQDPTLTGPRGDALRVLLYLFERDAAVRYLRSG
ncbi:MAG TPA: ATP-dependent DNA helicase RecG [Candidatus Sulfotelmatobacter sp.]|nr:ATP-dependent DNA helicase RecG [Candidatus Sulfotelmatobacter sp.]